MTNPSIYNFYAQIYDNIPSFETFPIYDDNNILIGGFSVYYNNIIKGFVAGTGYPAALSVSTNNSFWFTIRQNKHSYYGILSEISLAPDSINIQVASKL